MHPRFRFAPSPTGFAHIGSARTALYNYLLAQHMGGQFILRIEDTDRNRYVPGSVEDILHSFATLGIKWDEGPDKGGPYGPYYQSERLFIYHDYLHKLVDAGWAYPCFCSTERLEQVRKEQEAAGIASHYDRHCRQLDPEQARAKMESEPYVIRFKTPLDGTTVVHDMLRGELKFDNATLDDHVLLKRRRSGEKFAWPTYHGSSPIDDHLMNITHIVRGDEWLPSTPKHKMLFEAFGWPVPSFAHLPVILSPSGKGKMSKRDGTTAIRDMISMGYLPAALVNFLLLIGWSSGDDRELYTIDEAAKVFSFAGLAKSPAAYDPEKLDWFNGMYIRALPLEDLADKLVPYLAKAGYISATPSPADMDYIMQITPLLQERLTLLSDVVDQVHFFYNDVEDYETTLLLPKKTSKEQVEQVLAGALECLADESEFTGEVLHDKLKALATTLGLKTGQVFMPLRVAVTGRTVSPGSVTDIMAVLGPEKSRQRIKLATKKLASLTDAASLNEHNSHTS